MEGGGGGQQHVDGKRGEEGMFSEPFVLVSITVFTHHPPLLLCHKHLITPDIPTQIALKRRGTVCYAMKKPV